MRGVSALSSLLLAAVIIQLYGLQKFGEFSLALVTIRLVGVFGMFSLDSLLLRLLLRLQVRGGKQLKSRLIGDCNGFAMLSSLLAFVVVIAVSLTSGACLGFGGFWLSLIGLSPLIVMQNMANIQSAILRSKRHDFESQLVVVGIPIIVPLLVCSVFLTNDWRPYYLAEVAMVAGMVLAVVYGRFLTMISLFTGVTGAFSKLAGKRRRLLIYSSAVHSANVMNFFTEWYSGFLVALTQSFEVVGVLRVFQQFGKAVHLISHSVELPFSTEIANAHIERDGSLIRRRLVQSQVILGAAGIIFFLLVLLVRDFAFEIYDLDGDQVKLAFFIFMGLTVSRLFAGASASALNIMDATPLLIKASQLSILIGVALLSAMVPFLGLEGASLALGLQTLIQSSINYYFMRIALNRMSSGSK